MMQHICGNIVLDGATEHYINFLIENYARIHEIWLFGSRARGNVTASSDWDLLVFADAPTLLQMRDDSRLRSAVDDLFVGHDGNSFVQPWGDNPKSGSLQEWKWKKQSSDEATCKATKPTHDPEKLADVSEGKAHRLWHK